MSSNLSPSKRGAAPGCTQNDLAQMLGVSQMTVHRALNGHPAVKESLRAQIQAKATQHGYRPSASARAMRSGRFGNAALISSTGPFLSYTPPELLDGLHDELANRDMQLILSRLSDEKLTDESFVPKILREWSVDGILIDYIQHIPARLLDLIERHRIPAIWINSKQEHDCVRPDDRRAGQEATEFLIERGHREIAFVDYSHSRFFEREHYSAGDRFAGYKAAMEAASLAPRVIGLGEKFVESSQWLPFTQEWLGRPDRPSAALCYGFEFTPILASALALGVRVPDELEIVTFGSQRAEFARLPVTTFVIPEFQIGQAAITMLLQKLDAPNEKLDAQTFPFAPVLGATTR